MIFEFRGTVAWRGSNAGSLPGGERRLSSRCLLAVIRSMGLGGCEYSGIWEIRRCRCWVAPLYTFSRLRSLFWFLFILLFIFKFFFKKRGIYLRLKLLYITASFQYFFKKYLNYYIWRKNPLNFLYLLIREQQYNNSCTLL